MGLLVYLWGDVELGHPTGLQEAPLEESLFRVWECLGVLFHKQLELERGSIKSPMCFSNSESLVGGFVKEVIF